ncbi:Phosphoserine transaminase [Imshaugia aleurites]|uniref:Phosphoserine transaminase n=1 Tax=Imshaugia aleurites TaxID=172621 RepID=A0A8H3EKX4_9LECA|nr:Phosphoserine transaminase [Imshaugia aleurites]
MKARDLDLLRFLTGMSKLPYAQSGCLVIRGLVSRTTILTSNPHSSSTATRVLDETKKALISLLDIPENYEILFMHGGGSGEFSAVVFNMVAVWVEKRRRRAQKTFGDNDEAILLRVREELKYSLRLDYLISGSWSLKASQEAAKLLEPLGENFVNVALDAREANEGKFGMIPPEDTWKLTAPNANGGCGSAFV